jgi:hypothetical protein
MQKDEFKSQYKEAAAAAAKIYREDCISDAPDEAWDAYVMLEREGKSRSAGLREAYAACRSDNSAAPSITKEVVTERER